ncbi:hypothetical protein H4R18_002137 [Coemansia javaensis]|uniref:Uncharacterized protein n=1 Tax=Coemansia javaensis TaxID=2761396 RepID=A0A9W8HDS0_9FUNG|nr:hypothetical protein H4R18_002137 [Coemansia javaensis]
MTRVDMSSLGELVDGLSRLDYEAVKVASGRVMATHLRTGALMFSLLTVEMMYTSMDYLVPSSFQRGTRYLLDMYANLSQDLGGLLHKLVVEYEEDHQRLAARHGRAAGPDGHEPGPGAGIARSNTRPADPSRALHADGAGEGGAYAAPAWAAPRGSRRIEPAFAGGSRASSRAGAERPASTRGASEHSDPGRRQAPGAAEEAAAVLEELEELRRFVAFAVRFIEVRKTMIVLYRFSAATGPVVYRRRLAVMLDRCQAILQAIEPSPLYSRLLEHTRNEVLLVRTLVDWDAHIGAYDFVQSVTHMKKAKALLRTWACAGPTWRPPERSAFQRSASGSGLHEGTGTGPNAGLGSGSGQGLLYAALAKSSRVVQNLLWGGGGGGGGAGQSGTPAADAGGVRGIVVWLSSYVDHLSFKTAAYFQQLLAPHRLLHQGPHGDAAAAAAVLGGIWARASAAKTNLSELITGFMQANDCYYVALLFESSPQHPFSADGFAVAGTPAPVVESRVQACAVLFCYSNQKLLLSRGISVRDSLVHDVHSARPADAAWDARAPRQLTDVEWFRQNCLPDIIYIIDDNQATLDLELLGSSPLLGRLGADADKLLAELRDSVHDTVNAAVAELGLSRGAARPEVQSDATGALRLSAMKAATAVGQRQQDCHSSTSQAAATLDPGDAGGGPGKGAAADADRDYDAGGSPDGGYDNEAYLSLYKSYLQKSHLRSDGQQPRGRGAASRTGMHQPIPDPALYTDDPTSASPSLAPQRSAHGRRSSEAAAPEAAVPALPAEHQGLASGDDPARRRQTTGEYAAARRMPRRSLAAPHHHGMPVDVAQPLSAAEGDAAPQHGEHGPDDPRARKKGVSLSIRSFFRSVSLSVPHGSAAAAAAAAAQTPPENELARRVGHGERLAELFGAWSHDDAGAPQCPATPHADADSSIAAIASSAATATRPTSLHSLSFTTQPRLSVGAWAPGASSGPGAAPLPSESATPDMGGSGARLAMRPPRLSLQARQLAARRRGSRALGSLHAEDYAAALAAENQRYRSRPAAAYGPHADAQPQSLGLSHDPAPATSHRPPTPGAAAAAAARSEDYTYFYSRVGFPNVTLVAVFLNTAKGIDRRREAEHAWDRIVDIVRGTPLYEQLLGRQS